MCSSSVDKNMKFKITYIITIDIENSDYKDRDKNNTNMKTVVDMITNLVQICNKIIVFLEHVSYKHLYRLHHNKFNMKKYVFNLLLKLSMS